MADATSGEPCDVCTTSASSPPKACLYAACLGQLGQFGNQIFQFAFALLYADTWGLLLRTPPWVGARAYVGAALAPPPLPPASERVLLADRVILAHHGWKQWAEAREPLASIVRAQSVTGGLSGRALRKGCPQVNAASIADVPGERAAACVGAEHVQACVARGGALELWGFFQFDTVHFAPHRERLLKAFAPAAPLQKLVDAALAQIRGGSETTLVVVHVRCKQDTAALDGGGGGGYAACTQTCLLYTSPSPRDRQKSRMPSSA